VKYIPDFVIKLMENQLPRRTFYRQFYLKSRHWKRFSAQARKSAGGVCQKCKATGVLLDTHHLVYHLWHEKPSDVIVLCRSCHKNLHGRAGG
jgi:hypothetical protein